MWLGCCRCERTVLSLDSQVSLPYLCRRCREETPGFTPRPCLALPDVPGPAELGRRIEENREYRGLGLAAPHTVVIEASFEEMGG